MEQRKKHQKQVRVGFVYLILLCLHSFTKSAAAEASSNSKNHHFVLVHGACHGAWSWYKVASLLETSGHNVTALDLAGSGVDPQQAIDLKSVSDYFKPLTDFMASVGDDQRVVLVGHSFGGLAISHAMEHFPNKIAVAVFVTAAMPPPLIFWRSATTSYQDPLRPFIDDEYTFDDDPNNLHNTTEFGPAYLASYLYPFSINQDVDNQYMYGDGLKNPPATIRYTSDYLATHMYQLSPHEDLVLASTLMRSFKMFNVLNVLKVVTLSRKKYGSVKRVFVMSLEDQAASITLQRIMILLNPPDRVVKIAGSDHMVMMSKPNDLFIQLQTIADDYD